MKRRGHPIGYTRYPEDIPENNLRAARLSLGLSQADLAKACGTTRSVIMQLELGKCGPFVQHTMEVKAHVQALLGLFGCSFEEMFPREACKLSDGGDLLPCQHEGISTIRKVYKQFDDGLLRCVKSLPIRLRKVLLWRVVGEYTLEEVSDKLGVTRERVRQLESKALRLLRFRYANGVPS